MNPLRAVAAGRGPASDRVAFRSLYAEFDFERVLKGTASGLEIVLDGETFAAAWHGVRDRLAERPEFYRGSRAIAVLHAPRPENDADFSAFLDGVRAYGIEVAGLYGSTDCASLAASRGIAYLGEAPRPSAAGVTAFERKRRDAEAGRGADAPGLTDAARSLDADFAGARADFVQRRARIVAAREQRAIAAPLRRTPAAVTAEPVTGTLYHRGNVRGGQSLQQIGNIVVHGDVNPGAELTASGDILVFGALRGTAHAGAQGDASARVSALALQPTQLRIATFIAADLAGGRKPRGVTPETAFVADGRIATAPFDDPRVPG